jgi:hypothetical protein
MPSQSLFVKSNLDDQSSHAQRQAIGYLGFFLPVLLWLVSGWRSRDGIPGWGTLSSISLYYYSGAVAVLTGILAALAVFLFTYKGYKNDGQKLDQLCGKTACFAALGVAFFPTEAASPFTLEPSWWSPWMGEVHYVSATILFISFIVYSLVLFPRTGSAKAKMTPGKKRRNGIYRACGWGMVACVAWAGVSGLVVKGPIFWPESLALWAFAFSWLVKGQADWTLTEARKRLVSFGSHAWRSFRSNRK